MNFYSSNFVRWDILNGSPCTTRLCDIWAHHVSLPAARTLNDKIIPFQARTKMAEIYLKFNNDTSKFIECYKELSEENPTQENLIKLAEAYFSIRVSGIFLILKNVSVITSQYIVSNTTH